MRYIGSKENLRGFIDQAAILSGITSGVFCDLFAGTTVVGRYFKRKGYRIISNDIMEYSFVFSKAYIENNTPPEFLSLDLPIESISNRLFENDTEHLDRVLTYLNALLPDQGFMFSNYSDEGTKDHLYQRMYFSATNAGKIDAIRNQIEKWRQTQVITDNEFYILLAALLEAIPGVSNIAGTYGAFLKYWEPRSQKTLTLTLPPLVHSEYTHEVHRCDANVLIRKINCDILYIDPPYNTRQYATNYHILETVALWDNPAIYGKSGLRPYKEDSPANKKSVYCQRDKALQALQDLACNAPCRLFLMSYNSEGIMPHEAIMDILSQRGSVIVNEQTYRRFRSDSNHAQRQYSPNKHIVERIYTVQT